MSMLKRTLIACTGGLITAFFVAGCTPEQINMATQTIGMVTTPNGGVVNPSNVPAQATVNGKYSGLIQIMNCPQDQNSYGQFRDWGYWGGGAWCNQTGKAGHWVWVAPNWYVFQNKHR
ncbi:MAG: hypothetical protein VXW65_11135 [Pseudomonadota bacterium]|nr:hypothetical protein [Pseudomonadota bacterium]